MIIKLNDDVAWDGFEQKFAAGLQGLAGRGSTPVNGSAQRSVSSAHPSGINDFWDAVERVSDVSSAELRSAGGQGIMSAPATDGHGGGTRDNRFADRLEVFADTIVANIQAIREGLQLPVVTVSADCYMGNAEDNVSFKASIHITYAGEKIEVLSLTGSIGGSCKAVSFGVSFEGIKMKDLSLKWAQDIARQLLEVLNG